MSKKITYVLECIYEGYISLAEEETLNEQFGALEMQYHTRGEIDLAIEKITNSLKHDEGTVKKINHMKIIIYRRDAGPTVWMSRYDISRAPEGELEVKEVVYNEISP